ncbi:MAG: hypothetical protein AAGI30_09790 [Planctomycetota bacterium]
MVSSPVRVQLDIVIEPETAEDLLDALEAAGDDLDRLSANVVYQRFSALQGDLQTRLGTLYYEDNGAPDVNSDGVADGPADRAFQVSFRQLIFGDAVRDVSRDFIFDGEWLVEKEITADGKRFTKRRIAPPGTDFDPFRVGSRTLIPLPLGQRKADMLARYDTVLLGPHEEIGEIPEGDPLDGLGNAHQLKLTPKAVGDGGAVDDRFSEIRLWYERGTLLPLATLAVHRNGDESVIRLAGTVKNEHVRPFVVNTEVPVGGGWIVRVEE